MVMAWFEMPSHHLIARIEENDKNQQLSGTQSKVWTLDRLNTKQEC
jgi:hypothetical protein